MFEKDEDYRKARNESKAEITKVIKAWSAREETLHDEGFKEGVKFGYNKANEWHDLRKNPDDLPKECKGKLYLVNIYSDSQLKFEYAKYTPTVCLWSSEWERFEILELTVGSRIVNIRNVIAWKEIIPPKEML